LEAVLEGEVLRDDQWARIEPFVPGGRKGKRGPRSNGRRFVDAPLWMARSGGWWRDLPARFGPYRTAKRRHYRWIEMGVLDRLFEAVAAEPDLQWVMLDATVIRAHAQAAGARRERGSGRPGAWQVSRRLRNQDPRLRRRLGLPVRIILGSGQQNDMAPACGLIEGLTAQ
jgi:transposase